MMTEPPKYWPFTIRDITGEITGGGTILAASWLDVVATATANTSGGTIHSGYHDRTRPTSSTAA